MLFLVRLISFLVAITLSFALPVLNYMNKCDDSIEYYTTTRIINSSIQYSITTHDNKTNSRYTKTVLYYNPTFENYLNLIANDTNITLYGKVFFEYEILAPCYYTCAMEISANEYTSKTIAKHFETYYQSGKKYPMLCNSYGCRSGSNYCKTFQIHDEL